MNMLFDTLGASIAGGLILLMVFGAIMNMQTLSYNMQQQIILSEIAENLLSGRIIAGISYSGLESYLSKVGAGVPSGIDPIIEATSNSFKFRGQLTTTSSVSTFYILTETAVNSSYPLYVYLNDMSNPVAGPFWMASPLSITYYDINNNVISYPASNLNSIRSAKFDFNFSFETYRSDIDKKLVRYPTVIWKYFKNLYL